MSRGSSTRSAARATSFAPRRIPIRWRLAGGSALLTLIILCGFAGAVGALTFNRIHQDFDDDVAGGANQLASRMDYDGVVVNPVTGALVLQGFHTRLEDFDAGRGAVIRIVTRDGTVVKQTKRAADLGPPLFSAVEYNGYRIETRPLPHSPLQTAQLFVQYARPVADVEATIRRVRWFLVFGVLGGAGLALLAGLMIARRAMKPIAQLTATAREIERTRDPARRIPEIEADDEVAELARTLDEMLQALDAARSETESALARQRQFVADASHELRTPLTSVLANLELLAEHLDDEPREAARSALRSSQRMRRLVSDLLLLARADARREVAHVPTDVGQVVIEAAGELGAVADRHDLQVDVRPAMVNGARDELLRLVLNLMENALRHTPPGTSVTVRVERADGEVRVVVEDDGPGVPPELRERVFERFVRGTGDRGGSFGLGLSIVRAVAESHGGDVHLESPILNGAMPAHGTRFTVTLPATVRAPEQPLAPVLA